jgi:hypothetical protein
LQGDNNQEGRIDFAVQLGRAILFMENALFFPEGSNLDFLLGSSTAKTTTHPLGISMSMPSARITSMYMSPARSIESSHESRSPKLCIDEIGTTNDVEGEMEEGEGRTSANRSTGTITAKLDEDINESFG